MSAPAPSVLTSPWARSVEEADRAWVAAFDGTGLRLASGDVQKASAGGCTVLFDGLFHEREALARRFPEAHTDAELALAAYRACGERTPAELRGFFALVVWDAGAETLLAARDAAGVHPLFYAETGGNLVLSPSIDALLDYPGISKRVHRTALGERLWNRWPGTDETYYEAIRRVPVAHALKLRRGVRDDYRFRDPTPDGRAVDWVGDDAVERFSELLDQAVARCLALGRTGICLSGGLDSISVAATATDAAALAGHPSPLALSVDFRDDDGQSEADVQRGAARTLGLEHVLIPFHEAVGPAGQLRSALDITRSWPAPLLGFFSPAYSRLLLEGKERGCSVIVTGGGGDEWLSVTPYYATDLLRHLRIASAYRFWKSFARSYRQSRSKLLQKSMWRFGLRPFLAAVHEAALGSLATQVLAAERRFRVTRSIPDWLAPDPRLRRELVDRAEAARPERSPRPGEYYVRKGRSALEHHVVSLELEEAWEKGRRMGLKILMPYWDADLVDFLFRVPPAKLIDGGRSKALVRQTMARRFPQLGLEHQRKVTTGNFWPKKWPECRAIWAELGGAPALGELGIVDSRSLDRCVRNTIDYSRADPLLGMRVWDIVNLEAWLRPRL